MGWGTQWAVEIQLPFWGGMKSWENEGIEKVLLPHAKGQKMRCENPKGNESPSWQYIEPLIGFVGEIQFKALAITLIVDNLGSFASVWQFYLTNNPSLLVLPISSSPNL
jgi:hypothetical protein